MEVTKSCSEEAVVVTTVVRWAVIVVLVAHGTIHLLGAAKGFGWAEVSALEEPIGVGAAVVWLLSALLVVAAAIMVAARRPDWWWVVAAAALLSQVVILTSWTDAKAGTVANVVLLAVAVLGFAAHGPTSFAAEWDHRTRSALRATPAVQGVVTEADLAGLPEPVTRYIRRTGAVGSSTPTDPLRSDCSTSRRRCSGCRSRCSTCSTPRPPRCAARSPRSSRSWMRRDRRWTAARRSPVFNDMVVFAPSALVEADVRFTELSPTHVRAAYTRAGETITADLVFDVTESAVPGRPETTLTKTPSRSGGAS
jgi:hypothetical protein